MKLFSSCIYYVYFIMINAFIKISYQLNQSIPLQETDPIRLKDPSSYFGKCKIYFITFKNLDYIKLVALNQGYSQWTNTSSQYNFTKPLQKTYTNVKTTLFTLTSYQALDNYYFAYDVNTKISLNLNQINYVNITLIIYDDSKFSTLGFNFVIFTKRVDGFFQFYQYQLVYDNLTKIDQITKSLSSYSPYRTQFMLKSIRLKVINQYIWCMLQLWMTPPTIQNCNGTDKLYNFAIKFYAINSTNSINYYSNNYQYYSFSMYSAYLSTMPGSTMNFSIGGVDNVTTDYSQQKFCFFYLSAASLWILLPQSKDYSFDPILGFTAPTINFPNLQGSFNILFVQVINIHYSLLGFCIYLSFCPSTQPYRYLDNFNFNKKRCFNCRSKIVNNLTQIAEFKAGNMQEGGCAIINNDYSGYQYNEANDQIVSMCLQCLQCNPRYGFFQQVCTPCSNFLLYHCIICDHSPNNSQMNCASCENDYFLSHNQQLKVNICVQQCPEKQFSYSQKDLYANLNFLWPFIGRCANFCQAGWYGHPGIHQCVLQCSGLYSIKNSDRRMCESIVGPVVGSVVGVLLLSIGSYIFYKYYLKKRLVRKIWIYDQTTMVNDIDFHI